MHIYTCTYTYRISWKGTCAYIGVGNRQIFCSTYSVVGMESSTCSTTYVVYICTYMPCTMIYALFVVRGLLGIRLITINTACLLSRIILQQLRTAWSINSSNKSPINCTYSRCCISVRPVSSLQLWACLGSLLLRTAWCGTRTAAIPPRCGKHRSSSFLRCPRRLHAVKTIGCTAAGRLA